MKKRNMRFLLQLLGGTVLTVGTPIAVVACNNNNSTPDISNGVVVNNLRLAANTKLNYGDLNNNESLIANVASAITSAKNVDVAAATDFSISNDQDATKLQAAGQVVNFTVKASSNKIKGSFSFSATLSKPDISLGVTVSGLQTPVDATKTYGELNTNPEVANAVSTAISNAKGISAVLGTDYQLINDQDPNAMQTPGTKVTFTAIATGVQITGDFTFIDILGQASIAKVTVTDLQTGANPNSTYSALNKNPDITDAVANAINAQLGINVSSSDFILSNDQSGNQTPGQLVTFTVTAVGPQITGTFTFVDTLSKTDISRGVNVANLETPAIPTAQYTALNTDSTILNAVVSAINSAKGTTIAASDITLSNDKGTAMQAVNIPVTFTVTPTATSALTGSFKFIDILGKVNIASGVNITNPTTAADVGSNYGALNNNPGLIALVVNAINTAKGTNITANDISLTNDQPAAAAQVVGTQVKMTVTAIRGAITGSFTFVNTLAKPNISTGVNVTNLTYTVVPSATYGSLNTDNSITNAVATAISNAKNITATTSDFTITNDQTATANQVAGTTVTFTVTATTSGQLTGNFTFQITLGKISINTGVSVADLLTPVTAGNFGSLNSNTTIINAVVAAINTAKGTTITASDITLTNNQSATAQIGSGITIFTVTANATSTQITGSFTFVDTLQKVSISSGIFIPTQVFRVDTNRTYGDLNTYPALLQTVANAINTVKGVNVSAVSGVDFILTNASSGSQATGNTSETVTAVNTSTQITGSFTFVIALTQ